VDSQVRSTPNARIFWFNGLNQKEKLNVSSDGLLPLNRLMPFLGIPVFGMRGLEEIAAIVTGALMV